MCILIAVLVSMTIWFTTSCKQNYEELQEIPEVVYSNHNNIYRQDIGYHFNHQRGYNSVTIDIPKSVNIYMLDTKYKPVDYFWFRKFNSWFKKLLFENGIMSLGSGSENHDCDNFAMLYKSMVSVAGFKSGNKIEPATALITVKQVHEFGGVPGTGGLHMLIMVMTDQGWYIIEPQTGESILLEKYPNQKYIQLMIF